MDINSIVSFIGSVGFPIAACVGMFYLYDRTLKEFTASLNGITSEIKELKEEIRDIIAELKIKDADHA